MDDECRISVLYKICSYKNKTFDDKKCKMKKILFVFFLLYIFQISCTKDLKQGDLIFQNLDCGDFCEAIEAVTPDYKGEYYSHVGIVVEIDDFLKRTNFTDVKVGRLKNFKKFRGFSLEEIKKYQSKPYDSVFSISNDAYYCSELVYFLYKNTDNKPIFELKPMTFKKPGTNEIFDIWKEYFEKMNKEVPENEPGTNPGSIINSSFLIVFDIPKELVKYCKK